MSRPSLTTWHDVHLVGRRIVRRFGLAWPVIFEPLTGTVGCRSYKSTQLVFGRCDRQAGLTPIIKLRLHRAGHPNRALSRSTIFAVLAHEVAHLASHRHNAKHARLTLEIAAWLQAEGFPVNRASLLVKGDK